MSQGPTWVVVKILVPFRVFLFILRHLGASTKGHKPLQSPDFCIEALAGCQLRCT